jgi:hypothetical protein
MMAFINAPMQDSFSVDTEIPMHGDSHMSWKAEGAPPSSGNLEATNQARAAQTRVAEEAQARAVEEGHAPAAEEAQIAQDEVAELPEDSIPAVEKPRQYQSQQEKLLIRFATTSEAASNLPPSSDSPIAKTLNSVLSKVGTPRPAQQTAPQEVVQAAQPERRHIEALMFEIGMRQGSGRQLTKKEQQQLLEETARGQSWRTQEQDGTQPDLAVGQQLQSVVGAAS